jgi:hypothetical protein
VLSDHSRPEAGLDGFWIHRVLEAEGIESHVVDPASIAISRRLRRAKTDRIDGEALVRALLAYQRGEPRVCAMVRVPIGHPWPIHVQDQAASNVTGVRSVPGDGRHDFFLDLSVPSAPVS